MSHRGWVSLAFFVLLSALGAPAFATGSGNGSPCTSASQCASHYCVDGVCCNSACSGGCGVCNLTGYRGTCKPRSSSTVCRPATGTCDVAEKCTGSSLSCPADCFASSSTVCRTAAGTCDVAEKCTGSSAVCPSDKFKASTTVCRTSAGTCDVAERCSGSSAACPADAFASATTVCRASCDACDATETCSGSSAACPPDAKKPSGTVCRDANGTCDVAETCSGSSDACPTNRFASASTVCRDAVPGGCDAAENCSGTSASCPADAVKPSGAVCRDANGTCDLAETCNGASASCPADGFKPATAECRASAGACDAAENCSGTSAACPADAIKPSGSICRDANGSCDLAETCDGASASCPANGFKPATTECRASAGACDPAENCSGTSAACPANELKPSGAVCRDTNGACDLAETCDGASASCPADDFKPATAECRASAGACDPAENCSGTSASCPDDAFAPASTVCRAAAGVCDAIETCTGSAASCPTDANAPEGTPCETNGTCTAQGVCAAGNDAPAVNAGADQTVELRQGTPTRSFTLQRLSTPFNNPVGIEYHPPTNKMIVSVYWGNGQPHNFELVNADGTREQFSNVSGLSDEVYFAIPRDERGGRSIGGFIPGELYTGTGVGGVIARISPDGSTIDNPWVTLPGETGLMRGQLQFDRTGIYDGDLIVTTTAGHLWRVTAAGVPTMLASLGAPDIEGLTVAPNDPDRYGPWAGRILVGDETRDAVWAVDATGDVQVFQLGVFPENINIVPANENFFGVDFGSGFVMGASASQFKSMVGDVLISEEFGGRVWHVQWDGIAFRKTQIAQVAQWEHTAFGPAPLAEIGEVNAQVVLSGTATDDGRPPGSTLVTTWSVVNAPAGAVVTFADNHAPSTTAFFPQPGTYLLRLTATDGTLTTSDEVTITINKVTPHNDPPVADAGPDQTITIPEFAVLTGSASDDGVPIGGELSLSWTQESGPATVVFGNSSAGLTAGLFAVAGTYVLRLDVSDGELTGSDTVTITVNPETAIVGGTLLLTLSDPGPMPLGAGEFVTATLVDASVTPVPHFPIVFTLTGANPGTAAFVTDATGVAILPYTGRYPGADSIFATATGFTQSLTSNTVSVTWLDIPVGAPLLTQGWIKSPIHQSTITEPVKVELSDQITLTSGTLSYWPYSHPDQVRTLATGLTTGPGGTMAMFDPTVLSNGSYVIDLSGTDNTGRQRQSEVLVIVDGEYKPGRVVVETIDFSIPLAGLPITIGRRYDSLEKDEISDFGHGWSLLIGHPKLEKDLANNVAITMPNGKRTTFYFTGQNPVLNGGPVAIVIGFLMFSGYTPAPGTFGTLTSDGCPVMTIHPFNNDPPACFPALSPAELIYSPTQYTYTDANKTVYVMGATGDLRSITDRQGNSLTFTRDGIVSSAGKSVTFVRDGQGRITQVDYPDYFQGQDNAARYQYDAAGDLVTVDLAKIPFVFFRTMRHTYDSGTHRLKTSIDANGNTVRTSSYYADGRLESDTDSLSHVTHYTYDLGMRTTTTRFHDTGEIKQKFDAHGLVVSETDQLGNTTTHEYYPNLLEKRRVNALGEETTFTYNTFGSPESRTDVKGTVITEYDAANLPIAMIDRLQHKTTIDYDSHEAMSRIFDKDGTRFKFTNSEQGVPLIVEDAEGHTANFEYDAAGNPTVRTDRLGRRTGATYDQAGHQLTETTARSNTTTNLYYLPGWLSFTRDATGYERSFTYDPNGNLVIESDNAGRRTDSAYNALNQLTRVTHSSDGTTVKYTRDFRGRPLTMIDESNHTTGYDYDLAGNLIKTTFAKGTAEETFTTRTYDKLNRLASFTDEREKTTHYEYDPGCECSDRITKVIDPLGQTTETTYDANGRKTSVKDARGHTTRFTYDPRGNLTKTTFHDETYTQDAYDSRGRRVSRTDQTAETTLYGYDDEGQLTSVTDPLLKVTRYAYDFDGNLASVTDANNHRTSYAYDPMNRKTRRTLPLTQFETFAYDLVGRQIEHTDFRGKKTTMGYDPRDRLVLKTPDPSLGEPPHSYTYSGTGMRLTSTDGSGTTTYTHDERDRLSTKATPAGTLTYTYDLAGNLATIRSANPDGTSNPNRTSVNYAWDAANQLESVTDNRIGTTTAAAYTHTPTNRPSTLIQHNGVASTYSYDDLDRVTSMLWRQGAAPTPFASWSYTYNERGQRLTSTDITGRRAAYAYDVASRLASETITGDPGGANGALSYELDGAGNRLSQTSTLAAIAAATYSYNANDELGSDTYDANGNTLSSDGHTYAYDFENRLVSKDGSAVTITYDCDGNRVAKTVGGVTTRYLVDDLNPTGYLQVLEEVVGGDVQTRFTYGTSIVSQTRNVSSTPTTSYYGHDAHGNIAFLTDPAGAVTDSYDYDAWGILVAGTGNTPNSRLYAGEEFDPDVGLINLRARQYKPRTGRFVTVDPLDAVHSYARSKITDDGSELSDTDPHLRSIFELSGLNRTLPSQRFLTPIALHRYVYANGDPVDLLDPSGLSPAAEEGSMMTWINAVIRAVRLAGQTIVRRFDCWGTLLVECAACQRAWVANPAVFGICLRNANIRYLVCLARPLPN